MSASSKEIDPEIWKRNLRDTTMTDDNARTRWLNNYFAFWFVCEVRVCKRSKCCAGDPKACHDRWWPEVPERMKIEFRAALKALKDGLSPDEAMRKVEEDLARFDAMFAASERDAESKRPLPAACGGDPLPQAGEGKRARGEARACGCADAHGYIEPGCYWR